MGKDKTRTFTEFKGLQGDKVKQAKSGIKQELLRVQDTNHKLLEEIISEWWLIWDFLL